MTAHSNRNMWLRGDVSKQGIAKSLLQDIELNSLVEVKTHLLYLIRIRRGTFCNYSSSNTFTRAFAPHLWGHKLIARWSSEKHPMHAVRELQGIFYPQNTWRGHLLTNRLVDCVNSWTLLVRQFPEKSKCMSPPFPAGGIRCPKATERAGSPKHRAHKHQNKPDIGTQEIAGNETPDSAGETSKEQSLYI